MLSRKKYTIKESELKNIVAYILQEELQGQETGTTTLTQPQQTDTITIDAGQAPITGQINTNAKILNPAVQPKTNDQQQLAGTEKILTPEEKKKTIDEEAAQIKRLLAKNGDQPGYVDILKKAVMSAFGGISSIFSGVGDAIAKIFGWETSSSGGGSGSGGGMGMSAGEPITPEDLKNCQISTLAKEKVLSPNRSKRTKKVTKVTIHCMAGNLTAEGCGQLFLAPGRKASSNYGIGSDGTVAVYVPEEYAAWTSSSSMNDQQAITIEVANSAAEAPWPVSKAALNSLVALCQDICKRHGITPNWTGNAGGSFTEHRMFAAKSCPGEYLHALLASGLLIKAINGEMPVNNLPTPEAINWQQYNKMGNRV